MYHHFYSHSILILILFNFYCYSTPISYVDQNDQDQSAMHFDEQSMLKDQPLTKNEQMYYYNLLCILYNDCYNKDQDDLIYNEIKPKRLTSNLFHGIPKFGKRAFTSAFSGIPKFG